MAQNIFTKFSERTYFCTDYDTLHIDYAAADGNLQTKHANSNKLENLINTIVVDSATLNTMLEEVFV